MEHESLLRLGLFLGLFAVFAALEALLPRRARQRSRRQRWTTNLSIVAIDTAVLRVLALAVPLLAVGAAIDAQTQGWGFFQHTDWPIWIEAILAMLMLDFVIWAQHLASHKIPLLWRLHQVHHADTEMDVTTALRFHPLEIGLSMALKIIVVYALGPAAWAVVAFEALLNGSAMFNHANMRLPAGLDRVLRQVLVTPDMHRVHHSDQRSEHDSNYGFALSVWDRMFGTYIDQPAKGHDAMTLGLRWQDDRPSRLGWILRLPFRALK